MTLRVDPYLLGEEEARSLVSFGSDDLTEHATAMYRAGTEPLAATGMLKPTQDYVLLRAITMLEVGRSAGSQIKLIGGDRLKQTFCFEVVDVGPVVREVQKRRWFRRAVSIIARQDSGVGVVRMTYPYGSLDHIVPGNHVQCVASAADFMDPGGDGLHMLVRACFLPVAWNPDEVRPEILGIVKEAADHVRAIQAAEQARLDEIEAEREAAREAVKVSLGEEDEGPKAPMLIIPRHMRSAG